jgi:hypothetical protein
MLQYSVEHDERLKEHAPLFFKMCVPGLSEEYKMEVFYQVSNVQGFAIRMMIVMNINQPTEQHLSSFNQFAQTLF